MMQVVMYLLAGFGAAVIVFFFLLTVLIWMQDIEDDGKA